MFVAREERLLLAGERLEAERDARCGLTRLGGSSPEPTAELAAR